jgi:hypothetical protein
MIHPVEGGRGKTGKERTLPVLGFRDGEDWIVVASN